MRHKLDRLQKVEDLIYNLENNKTVDKEYLIKILKQRLNKMKHENLYYQRHKQTILEKGKKERDKKPFVSTLKLDLKKIEKKLDAQSKSGLFKHKVALSPNKYLLVQRVNQKTKHQKHALVPKRNNRIAYTNTYCVITATKILKKLKWVV